MQHWPDSLIARCSHLFLSNRGASRWRNEKCLLQCWGGRTTEDNEPLLSNITEPNSGCFLTCCSNPVLDIWRAMEENPSSLFPVGPAKLIPWEIISFLDSRGKKLQLWDVGACLQTQKTATDTKLCWKCPSLRSHLSLVSFETRDLKWLIFRKSLWVCAFF